MPLVTYPDSDNDEEDASNNSPQITTAAVTSSGVKRKLPTPASDLPPLPTALHDLYATNVRTAASNDPSLHGGRKRQVPHMEGHWPTHVYLEWHPTADEAQLLQDMITRVTSASAKVHSLLQSDLGAPLPLHISLSRSLSLHTNEREEFLNRLRGQIKETWVRHFEVQFDKVAWYANYERNRWFLSLGTARPDGDELNTLLHASNEACHAMKQPKLYVSPRNQKDRQEEKSKKRRTKAASMDTVSASGVTEDCSDFFHASLAWSLEAQALSNGEESMVPSETESLLVGFDCVKVKIGNTITSLPFKPRRMSQPS